MDFSRYLEAIQAVYDAQGLELETHAPARPLAIAALESEWGIRLVPALRNAWMQADGAGDGMPIFMRPGFLTAYDFLSADEVLSRHAIWERLSRQYLGYEQETLRDRHIAPGWFHPQWIPFASFDGNTLVLMQDYAPAPEGRVGQIIAFVHDPDEVCYVAEDFASFLRGSLEAIRYDPEEFLISVEED
ncbi:SMI1/KNR4 family protein [Uliginosibacterium gangwonense]|uniref:SMI1/KNR4 family protein n=1 Tax=Uliginosibacterium gangwonense TaxID=392736 RepID=UPI0003712576|nr:SMI1/KNR4 family protein [Uliginosibacterium gangwonense]